MAIPEHHKCVQSHKIEREMRRESCSARIRQFPKGKRYKGKIKAWKKFRIRVILKIEDKLQLTRLMKKLNASSNREVWLKLGCRNKYWKYGKYDD